MKSHFNIILAIIISSQAVCACTIFSARDDKNEIWVGNNEDGIFQFYSYINVFPNCDGKLGYYTLSFNNPENGNNSNAQGGMNEAGLFFDINALDASGKEYPIKNLENKKSFPTGDANIYRHILGNFTTVHEVVAFFEQYWFDFGFNRIQMHFADRNGNFAMIGPSGSKVLEKEPFQISTNFSICANDPDYGCWRYPLVKQMLEENEIGVENMVNICESTAQTSDITTMYSNVSNLNSGDIWFYYALDYRHPFRTNINDLISKGRKSYLIKDLFVNNAFNKTYQVLLNNETDKAYKTFNSLKLSVKQKKGLEALFANRVMKDQGIYSAYPFLMDYIKIDSLNRHLQITKAIWEYHYENYERALKTILSYKARVPDTGMDVEKLQRRFEGKFDANPNAFIELSGYEDATIVFVKGLSIDIGNFLFKKNGKWVGEFNLAPGVYNYSFIVDGKELLDCCTPIKEVSNNYPGNLVVKTHQLVVDMTPETYRTTIRVITPKANDVVHITGNQINLTNWVSLLKMKKISDFEREITLDLHYPVIMKFTRGTWLSEGVVKGNEELMDGYFQPLKIIEPKLKSHFEIVKWKDSK